MATIKRLLVANRGEVSVRIFRTCRELGIETVAVYSDADRDALHARTADLAVPLGGRTPRESYLDIEKVLGAARRAGADAVHPGYGFLAEDAAFSAACTGAGLLFVGPPAHVIDSMARKVEAKAIVGEAGVPLLPGKAVTGDDEGAWPDLAADVGYPLLVKASAGGGGKGMRTVSGPEELADAIRAGRREAESAFGDDTVFLERLLLRSRHVEVQIFGDDHGNVVHLLERDCSVQRRHQKVIEEAPAPNLSEEVRRRLRDSATRVAKNIGYTNAGTVEFLVSGDEHFFLEVNTRLQVEHPVTEAVTGLDLVRMQLEVAMGRPLPFGQEYATAEGHAVEARLYAEDPAQGYLPSVGVLRRFAPPEASGVRWDLGVSGGMSISSHYDPLLAKVIAHAPTRIEAAHRLSLALRRLHVTGVVTNREMLVAVLSSDAFLTGDVHTGFLDRHPELLRPEPPTDVRRIHAVAATLSRRHRRHSSEPVAAVAPAGWRNLPSQLARQQFDSPRGPVNVTYGPMRHGRLEVAVDDAPFNGVRKR